MIELRVEWQDAPGVRDPVLARTWCRLTMDVDGQVLSRAIDHRSQSLRDGIYGSALPLCSWIVENWWCLQHEAYRFHRPWRSHDLAVNVDHRAWVQRHSLRAVGEGGVLPDLMLFRDGDGMVVRWFADRADAAHPYLRFVGDGQASMPFDEMAHGLTDFVIRVLDRIEDMDAPEVEALRRDWAAIATAPPDERELCIWSARVGLDPYDPEELTDQREELLRASVSSLEGELRGDLLDAATADALLTDARWIDAAHDVALGSGLAAANEPALTRGGHSRTAHETGYDCARTLRRHLGANGGPVEDMRADMRALGWAQEPLLTTDSKPTSPLDAILDRSASGAPVVVAYQDGGIEPERFRLAGSLFFRHFTAAPGRRLITAAHTWDQRASRAFAAEFLEISPDEIRAIRKRLGLTQVEAGRLVGGGPRAFTKYEAGTLKPAASVLNLLRVLEANPDAIATLGGSAPRRSYIHAPRPFEIGGEDIERLTPSGMHELLRRLLEAESFSNDLPGVDIKVSSDINARDGGEDGRIEWTTGPKRTRFLPARLCQFQSKAGKIEPREAACEALKPMVRQVLGSRGCYVIFCGWRYVQELIARREAAIRGALRAAGIEIADDQIEFRDADQIADWANYHQPVAMWVREQIQPGMIGPFRPWDHWAGREHGAIPWVPDERLVELTAWLQQRVRHASSVSRVVGLWGIGKSRLTLQALRPRGNFVSDIVMYAVESECGALVVKQIVQKLADSGTRAIVVVDQCSPETHRDLAGFASRGSSRLSLITIDDEVPTGDLDKTRLVGGGPRVLQGPRGADFRYRGDYQTRGTGTTTL